MFCRKSPPLCIPGRKSRNEAVKPDKRRYKQRNRIQIMPAVSRTGDGPLHAATGAPTAVFSAIALAATVIFRL